MKLASLNTSTDDHANLAGLCDTDDVFSSRRLEKKYRAAGVLSMLMYVSAVSLCITLIIRGDTWATFAIAPMIVVYHGTHEAVHGTLVPRWLLAPTIRRILAYFLATVGFSIIGHNYLYLRWSHRQHHALGRLDSEHTIDGKTQSRHRLRNFQYYLSLAGFNCHFHELCGYIYALIPAELNIVDRRFKPASVPYKLYWVTQGFVLVTTGALLYSGGIYFLFLRIVFAVYWGMMQNVAHYGLEHGSIYAARTYRVASAVEFLLFKAGLRHVEHHMFPNFPGYCLDDSVLQYHLNDRLGFEPHPKYGLITYWKDVLRQLRGPDGGGVKPHEWRDGDAETDHANTQH